MHVKPRRLKFLDLILWSETTVTILLVNLFELIQLKIEQKQNTAVSASLFLWTVMLIFSFEVSGRFSYFRKTLRSGEATIVAGPIRYQNFPDSEEKQVRFEALPVTF